MLNALGAPAHDDFISCAHPSVLEGFFGGLLVVQVAQDNTWGADNELSGRIVGSNFFAIWGNNAALNPRKQTARCTQEDVSGMG